MARAHSRRHQVGKRKSARVTIAVAAAAVAVVVAAAAAAAAAAVVVVVAGLAVGVDAAWVGTHPSPGGHPDPKRIQCL